MTQQWIPTDGCNCIPCREARTFTVLRPYTFNWQQWQGLSWAICSHCGWRGLIRFWQVM